MHGYYFRSFFVRPRTTLNACEYMTEHNITATSLLPVYVPRGDIAYEVAMISQAESRYSTLNIDGTGSRIAMK